MESPIVESKFTYKGFTCVVLFMPMGYRCGYVGIHKGHKYYGTNYEIIPINCHCGLTYSDKRLHRQDDKNTWWIGFDCGHCCDGFDIEKIKEYFSQDKDVMIQLKHMENYYRITNDTCIVRSKEFVEEECKSIVYQLIERGN